MHKIFVIIDVFSYQEEKRCAIVRGHDGQLQDWTTIPHYTFDQRPAVCGRPSW